jgi:hypothetical protein
MNQQKHLKEPRKYKKMNLCTKYIKMNQQNTIKRTKKIQ